MLTTIPNNNPHKRNRLIFKWLSGNDPCFVSLLGFICLNTGGHPSPPLPPGRRREEDPSGLPRQFSLFSSQEPRETPQPPYFPWDAPVGVPVGNPAQSKEILTMPEKSSQ